MQSMDWFVARGVLVMMQPDHFTPVDPDAVHQVHFTHVSGSSLIGVSCNCRRKPGANFKANVGTFLMGESRDLEGSRELYNNPANHFAPFDPEKDAAKW